jgi:hypothetical protein
MGIRMVGKSASSVTELRKLRIYKRMVRNYLHHFRGSPCIHFCHYFSPLWLGGLLALTATDFRNYLIRKKKSQVFGRLSEGGADPECKMVCLPI